MAGKMRAVTAATALVNMLDLVCDRAIACYESEDLFDPVYFDGLLAQAQFVAERVYFEPNEALASAQKRLRSVAAERDEFLAERNAACDRLRATQLERDELRAKLDAATAERNELRERCDELRGAENERDTFRDALHELKAEFDELKASQLKGGE